MYLMEIPNSYEKLYTKSNLKLVNCMYREMMATLNSYMIVHNKTLNKVQLSQILDFSNPLADNKIIY